MCVYFAQGVSPNPQSCKSSQGVGVAAPMASTLDSLLLVVPLRRKSEEEISLKSILKILFIILNSAFYTGYATPLPPLAES